MKSKQTFLATFPLLLTIILVVSTTKAKAETQHTVPVEPLHQYDQSVPEISTSPPAEPVAPVLRQLLILEEPVEAPSESCTQVDEDDVYWLAVLIYFEAGYSVCSDRHQQLVAMTAINRTKSKYFRDTIKEVIAQQDYIRGKLVKQYNPAYLTSPPKEIPQRMFDNARLALEGNVECPSNVVYQAEFKQGSGIYETFDIGYSITYFCFE